MLSGAEPARIQCLTFTKAAAAEMALRLQRTLGEWVTLEDAPLDRRLRDLAHQSHARRCATRARALFARVLDLPGGMRIGTIHAFCQSLLRRFPLEAALSPHFALVDDSDAAEALRDAREDMLAAGPHRAARARAAHCSPASPRPTISAATSTRCRPTANGSTPPSPWANALEAAQRRALGVAGSRRRTSSPRGSTGTTSRDLREAARDRPAARRQGLRESAGRMLDWLGLHGDEPRRERLGAVARRIPPRQGRAARPSGGFVSKAVTDRHPDLARIFLAECERIRDDRAMPAALCAWPSCPPPC